MPVGIAMIAQTASWIRSACSSSNATPARALSVVACASNGTAAGFSAHLA